MIYIFDGSFEGLLTTIYEAYYNKYEVDDILCGSYQQDLLRDYTFVDTEQDKADKVAKAIIEKISETVFNSILTTYLSDFTHAPFVIYKFLKTGFKMGAEIENAHGLPEVDDLRNIRYKVDIEAMRMTGLIRFSETKDGIYYAKFSPDHNITALIADHFCERYKIMSFVLHDVKRNVAALYNSRELILVDDMPDFNPNYTESEMLFRSLFKQYYDHIGIKERANDRVRRGFMPVRYWKYLTEINTLTNPRMK